MKPTPQHTRGVSERVAGQAVPGDSQSLGTAASSFPYTVCDWIGGLFLALVIALTAWVLLP